jgi:hypothetical protein
VASSSIGLVLEELLEQMRLFGIQIRDFPNPAALGENHGAASGVAKTFHSEMEGLARDLRTIATTIVDELEETELRVRAAARDMAETDAAAADTARSLLAQLEGIAVVPVPVPVPQRKSMNNPTASPSGGFL